MKIQTEKIGDIFQLSGQERARDGSFPVMSITMHRGLIDQSEKFKKRVASINTSNYKIVYKNELVVGFPIDEGVIGFQTKYNQAIVSPAYDIWRIKDGVSCNIDFIGRYLRSNSARRIYASKMRGAVARRRSITKDDFLSIKIPFPSLYDQVRIATILTRAEELIAKRIESIKMLDELLKSTFLEMFGDPVKNSKRWKKKRINEIGEVRIGPFGSLLHTEDYIENGIPIINPSHIVGGEIIPDHKLTITNDKYKELESYQLKINDVIVARRGEIGRCAIVRTAEPLVCGTGSIFIRIFDEYLPLLLQYQIYNTSLKGYLESRAKGITLKNLNATTVGNLQILYPPLPLQKKFVAIAEKIQSLKSKYTQSLIELENIYSSLCQRAFKGELDLSKVLVGATIEPEVTMADTIALEDPTSKQFSEKELATIIKAMPVRVFSFDELMRRVDRTAFEPRPEYDEIKSVIFTLLRENRSILSQSFEEIIEDNTKERIKKIMLRVNV